MADRKILGVRLSTDGRKRTRDDRGVERPLQYPRRRRSVRLSRGERRALHVLVWSSLVAALLIPLGMMGVIAIASWQFTRSGGDGIDIVLLAARCSQVGIVMAMLTLVVSLMYLTWPGRRTRVERGARLRDGVCAACEYGLGGLAVEDDGCVVCPECGAAWRLGESGDSAG